MARRRLADYAPAGRRRGVRQPLEKTAQLQRERKDDGVGTVGRDVAERRQIAELHRLRPGRQDLAGLGQPLGRLELALRVDDLGTPETLGFRLLRYGADHPLVEVDVLQLDVRDLDAPGVGSLVEDLLQRRVQSIPLAQHLVQLVLAQHRAQRRLGQLARRLLEVLDPDHGMLRIDHAIVDHRVDLHRDIVLGDDVLARHVEDADAEVDPDHLLDHRDDQDQARSFHFPEAAELEDDRALVLPDHLERCSDQRSGRSRRPRRL